VYTEFVMEFEKMVFNTQFGGERARAKRARAIRRRKTTLNTRLGGERARAKRARVIRTGKPAGCGLQNPRLRIPLSDLARGLRFG